MFQFLSRVSVFLFVCVTLFAQDPASLPITASTLDYSFFKERVQPVFLKKRAGHARCVTCHTHRIPPLERASCGSREVGRRAVAQKLRCLEAFRRAR